MKFWRTLGVRREQTLRLFARVDPWWDESQRKLWVNACVRDLADGYELIYECVLTCMTWPCPSPAPYQAPHPKIYFKAP